MGKQSKHSRNKRTESKKQKVARQPSRTEENKLRKLLRHIAKFPNDLIAQSKLTKEK